MKEMTCDLCNKTLYPLDAHMGYIDGKLCTTHIDCWNKHFAKEIEAERAAHMNGSREIKECPIYGTVENCGMCQLCID